MGPSRVSCLLAHWLCPLSVSAKLSLQRNRGPPVLQALCASVHTAAFAWRWRPPPPPHLPGRHLLLLWVIQAPLRRQSLTPLVCCHACFFHWALNCLGTGPCLHHIGVPRPVQCLTVEMLSEFWLTKPYCLCRCPCKGVTYSPAQNSFIVNSQATEITGVE